VTLQAAMQGRARQVRDGRLQGVQAVVERQHNMPSEGDNDASSSTDRTVDPGSFGPVGRSETEVRAFHLATVFGLTP
jgi:hypothetical protein